MTGDSDYNDRLSSLIFGEDNPILKSGRFCTLQAPGGSGALRVGAEVIAEPSQVPQFGLERQHGQIIYPLWKKPD